MAVAGRAVHHRVVDDGRLDVVGTDVGLRSHRDRGRGDRVAVDGADAPLGRARKSKKLRQRNDVPDRVGLACCHAERDAVGVLDRDVVRDVALGSRSRHPHRLRRVRRAGKHAALLEVTDRTGVVPGRCEHRVNDGRSDAHIRTDIVVRERGQVRLPDEAVQAVLALVDVVARRASDR